MSDDEHEGRTKAQVNEKQCPSTMRAENSMPEVQEYTGTHEPRSPCKTAEGKGPSENEETKAGRWEDETPTGPTRKKTGGGTRDSVSRSTVIASNPQLRPDILVRIEEYERYTTEIPDGIWKPAGPFR